MSNYSHHPTVEITMGSGSIKSQSKLTRTQSSLLRSSPTVRSFSSVTDHCHSYSQLNDIEDVVVEVEDEGEDDEEAIKKRKPGSIIRKSGSTRFRPVLALTSLSAFTLLSILFFFLFYLNREEIPTSENLLVALTFIAITLFFASKNKTFINHTLTITKQKLLLLSPRTYNTNTISTSKGGQVKWLIGETKPICNNNNNNGVVITKEGVEFYSNGDYYEGEFHKGKCNGSGVYHYIVNGRYEGDWVDGRYDGYGIESWARGSKYRGQYRLGLRHGFGVYRFYTGDSYAGEWCNGQSHGVGAQTCSDGSCYVGEFKCALKHGLGCYYFRNGDRYAGEYFGDKIHGFGVYHFANGHCYEGSWHEGRKQGFGMYTFRNSDTKCGEWDAGNLKTPIPRLTDAVLRAVQAARKNAENAINVRRVDEQVNKAAMAAATAATAARVAAIKAVQNRMVGKFCDTNV